MTTSANASLPVRHAASSGNALLILFVEVLRCTGAVAQPGWRAGAPYSSLNESAQIRMNQIQFTSADGTPRFSVVGNADKLSCISVIYGKD